MMNEQELTRIKQLASTDSGLEQPMVELMTPQLRSVAKYGPKGLMQGRMTGQKPSCPEQEPPTALAVSLLDVKAPAARREQSAVAEHWCVSHYLLDGHHKAALVAA